MGGGVPGHGESVGSGRGIANQDLVEAAGLVGLGELGDVTGVDARGDLVGGVDATAEQADGDAAGGVSFPVDANHPDDFDIWHCKGPN